MRFPCSCLLGTLAVAVLLVAETSRAAPLASEVKDGFVLKNARVTASFDSGGRMTGFLPSEGQNLIDSAYLTGPYLAGRSRVSGRIVRSSAEVGEVSFTFRANGVEFDLRYAILPDSPGVYCFIAMRHQPQGRGDDALGFFKHVIQADPRLFTFLQSTPTQQGYAPPSSSIAATIGNPSDHTYRLNPSAFDNGYCREFYSKYDYMQYASEHGLYGLYSPVAGIGLYVINPGLDWTPGGPTKNLQTVHDPAIINDIINDEHMLENFSEVKKVQVFHQENQFSRTETWTKLAGPFFIYFNRASTALSAWSDAGLQLKRQERLWPYAWMSHPDYPLVRASVSGTLSLEGGSAAGAWCVLASPDSDWQAQCLGYIPWTRADAEGRFQFKSVRPGRYCLYAYGGDSKDPRRNNPFNEFKSVPIDVGTDAVVLPTSETRWVSETHGEKLFQIGVPDRSTREFHFGNLRRQYALWTRVPLELDYRMPDPGLGSDALAAYEARNWYYLERGDGSRWNIHFPNSKSYATGQKATLTLAIVGTCVKPLLSVSVNGKDVVNAWNRRSFPQLSFGDDASVRRCAVSGGYYHHAEIAFPAGWLKADPDNVLTLSVRAAAGPGGREVEASGIMYDALKLEVR